MKRALVIRAGSPDIADAIVGGMGRAHRTSRQTDEALRRVAMRQHTPQEWDAMIAKARYDYGQDAPVGRVHAVVLGVWARLWMAIDAWYRYLSAWNREG